MEPETTQVTEKIQKGSYFTEALDWYHGRYTFIQTQFSQLLIITIASVIAFMLTMGAFFGLLPLNERKLFVIYHNIVPETYIEVERLMKKGEDPDYALVRYYVGEYVKSREEYIISRTERNFNFVYSLSGDNVLQEYLNGISPDNPNSPFVVFANRGTRDVTIKKITFYDVDGSQIFHAQPKGKAVILFLAQENFGASGQKATEYAANIEYDYKKITVDQKTEQLTHKAEMIITNYTTKLNSGVQ